MWSYYHWIRNNVAANTPWDKFASFDVTATGSTLENGAANFYALHDDPRVLPKPHASVPRHVHQLRQMPQTIRWRNGRTTNTGGLPISLRAPAPRRDPAMARRSFFAAAQGDIAQPLRGRPQAPRPLDGSPLPMDAAPDRREALAKWLTSRDNPYFTRAIANRLGNFMGVGLIEKVDDLRVTTRPATRNCWARPRRILRIKNSISKR